MKDAKIYALRPAKTPQVHPLLSGTVVVMSMKEGKKLSFVHFKEALVDAIGKKLPQGLSTSHPGYIKVIEMAGGWRVMAMYLNEPKGVVLWDSPDRPSFIGKLHNPEHVTAA